MNKKIRVIVDGDLLSYNLARLIDGFVSRHQIVEFGNRVDPATILEMVVGCFEDEIDKNLEYCTPTNSFDSWMRHIFPWYATTWKKYSTDSEKYWLSVNLFKEIIKPFRKMINPYIRLMRIDPFDIWEVSYVGKDLVIQYQNDFRIVDWERRMRSGTWTHEA